VKAEAETEVEKVETPETTETTEEPVEQK